MRKLFASFVIVALLASYAEGAVAATPVVAAGKSCNKPGAIQSSGKTNLRCMITGARTAVWKMYSPTPSPVKPPSAPTLSPVKPPSAPTSFSDLYANRLGISYAAWSKAMTVYNSSSTIPPSIQTFTGSNTKPFEKNATETIGIVARLISSSAAIKKVNIIYFNQQDVDWAANLVQTMMGKDEYQKGSNTVGGPLVSCIQGTDCNNSLAWTTADGIAYLILGVTSNPDSAEINYGVSDTEFYNATMRGIYIAHNDLLPESQPSIYPENMPPFWLYIGGEVMASCLGGSNADFKRFNSCLTDRGSVFKSAFPNATIDSVSQYLDISNVSGMWRDSHRTQMNSALAVGTGVMEIFISLKGPGAMEDFFSLMSEGKSFADAFQAEFGTSWQTAEPEIAKVLIDKSANWY